MEIRRPPVADQASVRNPLWLIALFLSLSEITAGIATTQADGWIQGMLAVFAVVFPLIVGAVFFALLYTRPYVLYAPGDFSAETPVSIYVEAVTSNKRRQDVAVDVAVAEAIERVLDGALRPGVNTEALVEETVAVVRRNVASRSVSVRLDTFHRGLPSERLQYFIDDRTTVNELLDFVYFALADYVDPFTYGRSWLLKSEKTGRRFEQIGSTWAKEHLGTAGDDRLLSDVGITSGGRLAVARLRS